MRVIIQSNYDNLSKWAARYVIDAINKYQPSAEHPFVLGLPTGRTRESLSGWRSIIQACHHL